MKKILFVFTALILLITLTACDGELTLPSGVTLPTDITTDQLTTDDIATGTDITTEIPTTTGSSTTFSTGQTTDEPTTEQPTTTELPTTSEPTTIRNVTINFDSQGGDALDSVVIPETQETYTPPTPIKVGYIFDGWYMSLEYLTEFVFSPSLADQVTIYAKWIPEEYTINYYDIQEIDIMQVFSLNMATFVITDSHHVYATGKTYLDTEANPTSAWAIINEHFNLEDDEVIKMISGNHHYYALTSNHRVFSWGSNSYGLVGNDSTSDVFLPVDITGNFNLNPEETIIHIDGEMNNAYAITSEGRLFVWGSNAFGQLGDGTSNDHHLPYDLTPRLSLLEDEMVIDVNYGLTHAIVLTNFNRIFTFGGNMQGQLGTGSTSANILTPTQIHQNIPLQADDVFIEVETYGYANFVLTASGDLFAFGLDSVGQFGIEQTMPVLTPINLTSLYGLDDGDQIIDILATNNNAFFMTSDELIYAIGFNTNNNLFLGTDVEKLIVATDISTAIPYEIEDISFSDSQTIIFTNAYDIYFIGRNDQGQSGNGNFNPLTEPYLVTIPGTGHQLMASESVAFESSLDLLQPQKDAYTFIGWFTDESLTTPFDLTTMPMEDIDLFGKWQVNQYTISFEENGGSEVLDITQDFGSQVLAPAPPTRQGYTFLGWFEDESITLPYTFFSMPMEDITLYAGWQVNEYDIILTDYDDNGDMIITADYLSPVQAPSDPTKEGHTFIGWFEDEALTVEYAFDTMPLNGITLYPKWQINQYTIIFEENGGSDVLDITQDYMSDLIQPNDPTRDGYTFIGWFSDQTLITPYTFDTMPLNGMTLYAGWDPAPAIVHFMVEGVDIPTLNAFTGDGLQFPTPSLTGKNFIGWFEDENFTTPVTWTEIPAGETTIYGQWEDIVYTITYEENGGSEVTDETHVYKDLLTEPTPPSKDGYIFIGWYIDQALSIGFAFDQMPDQNITLYAKWADASNPNSIINQVSQPAGTSVTIQGVVYASMKTGVLGYFIYDDTGYIAIDGNHSNLNIGDQVEVQGTLAFDGDTPFVINVTNVSLLQSGQALPVPIDLDMINLSQLTAQNSFYVYHIQGILVYDEVNFFVFDPNSLNMIVINPDSINDADLLALSMNVGYQIALDMVYTQFENQAIASMIDYQITPLTISEQGAIIQTMITSHLNLTFYSGDQIPLDQLWVLEYIDLTYSIPTEFDMYFDPVNMKFLDTDTDVIIPVTFTLNVDNTTYDFIVNVTLKPLDISTIAEVIDDTTMASHIIDALVVMKSEMDMLIKDDTGYLYVYNLPQVQVGDMVRLVVINDMAYPMPYMDFYDGDLIYKQTLSSGNPLNLTLNVLNSQDFLALDTSDLHIYGQYIELRGFVRQAEDENFYGFVLENDDYSIRIMNMTHGGFEKLFDYEGLEVHMRGFLVQNEHGQLSIYYEGIRGDIRLPDYTDQELVDVLEELFYYYYGNMTFNSFDMFEMPTYHPMLGGDITWTFDDPNYAYFDFEHQRFLYSDTDQPFTMTISVTYGTASKTINFASQLNAMTISTFSDLASIDNYNEVFVKGIVIFHSPEFILLMNDLGEILFVEGYQLDVYTGDEVLLFAEVNRNYQYGNFIYLQPMYYSDMSNMVVEIISRDNALTLNPSQTSVEDINLLTQVDDLNNKTYVEVEGLITYVDDNYRLETANGYIILEVPYEQVNLELSQYMNQYVTLRAYVLGHRNNFYILEDEWFVMVLGEPGDIAIIEQTEQEIFIDIENYIITHYQTAFTSDQTIDFYDPIFYYPDVTMTYTTLDDANNIFDFASGYSQYIQAIQTSTDVQIQVDLELNGQTHTFTFTITINPVEDINVTNIVDLVTDGQTVQHVQGQVIITSLLDYDTYLLLIQDSTGIIFVTMDKTLYQSTQAYYNQYINDELLLSGTITQEGGRYQMMAQAIDITAFGLSSSISFTPITIEDYLNIDLTDPLNYGVPYEITGVIYHQSTPDGIQYFLTNGTDNIHVLFDSVYYSFLTELDGMMVTLRVFSYGPDDQGKMSVQFDNRYYDANPSIWLSGYDEQAGFDLIKQYMIADANEWNPLHNAGEYIWYPGLSDILIDAFNPSVTFTVVEGNDYVEINNNYLVVLQAPQDMTVVVEVSITINDFTGTFYLKYYINGFEIQTLNDLFDTTPGTDEIALEATVINSSFGLHYFLIEGQVYTLHSFAYGGYQPGTNVIILGQRRVIDGVSDYTYNIQLLDQYTTSELNLVPVPSTIESLYTNDYQANPINQSVHALSGFLEFDPYSQLFMLTENGHTVYVRMLQEAWSYEEYLWPYIGEYVTLDVLLPMDMMRGQAYYIVDVLYDSGVHLKDYTAQEDVALIKARLQEQTTIDVLGGDTLTQHLPQFYQLHPYTSIEYTLVDPLDESYYDADNLVFNQVDIMQTIELLATITYDDMAGNIASDSVTITVNIHQRLYTPLDDVLYGQTQAFYAVQGVIVALGMTDTGNYDYAIISDGVYQIYVSFAYYEMFAFDGENLTLSLGDEIEVFARRSYYDAEGTLPMLIEPTIIKVLSQNNDLSLTPTQVSVEDILTSSFTDLTNFHQYVSITGHFVWVNDYYNPHFKIVSDLSVDRYIQLLDIHDPSLETTLQGLNGQDVVMTGYIIGYQTLNQIEWYFIYESHQVITE
mgnify:CR=1 FL=1